MSTSLDQYHDVIIPPAVGSFPLAEGWYMLFALIAALALYLGINALRAYLRNSYRREALIELRLIRTIDDDRVHFHRLLELLRRTALAAYGRERIAALDGKKWWSFLDEEEKLFTIEHRQAADGLLYSEHLPTSELLTSFEQGCERWIRQHKRGEHDHL